MPRLLRISLPGLMGYASWLGMLVFHELGHVVHALASGGRVERVSIPLWGFSETFYVMNPHPQFVAWGGAIWGSILPLIVVVALTKTRPRRLLEFFAGFCLIANGLYLGVGWVARVGDAGDLLQHGAPVWALCGFGIVSCGSGLLLWHRLGSLCSQPAPTNTQQPLQ